MLRELAKLSEGMLFLGGHVANAETARLLARLETSPLMQTNDDEPFAGTGMTTTFPTAQEYSAQKARHPAMSVVDIRSEQAAITDSYRNQVLLDVNEGCLRLAVFEGEYRWHHHPDSDELFLVVAGELQVDFEHGTRAVLTEWQSLVVPAGIMHRTRAIGRTVNVTFEKRHARTVFVEPTGD